MTFTPNIPAVGQSLGSSRTQVLGNFSNYNTLVSVDHVSPNAAGQGQHKQITLNTYGTSGSYTQTGSQSYLYSSNASASGSQVVYQPSIVAAGFKVPVSQRALCRALLTAGNWSLSPNGPYGAASNFNVGSITHISSTQFTVNFSNNILAGSDYFVQLNLEMNVAGATLYGVIYGKSNAGFSVTIGGGATGTLASVTLMVF